MRTREVWIHAVDLDNGARFGDIPEPVLDGLLADITGKWRITAAEPNLTLAIDGRAPIVFGPGAAVVEGPLSAVVRWVAGRGPIELDGNPGVDPPRWL